MLDLLDALHIILLLVFQHFWHVLFGDTTTEPVTDAPRHLSLHTSEDGGVRLKCLRSSVGARLSQAQLPVYRAFSL